MTTPNAIQALYDDLSRLRKEWVTRGWTWDSRLSCVCSSFSADLADVARATIEKVLPLTEDAHSLAKAPPWIQAVAQKSGGARPGQLIFSTRPVAETVAYGLWWPWGDDVTISLRVGLTGRHAKSELQNLQQAFGTEQ